MQRARGKATAAGPAPQGGEEVEAEEAEAEEETVEVEEAAEAAEAAAAEEVAGARDAGTHGVAREASAGAAAAGSAFGCTRVHLRVLEVRDVGGEGATLSTVLLRCGALRGRLCGALCLLLRSAGHPVVGDRFARRERGVLPRACGGLKARLQIQCLGVAAAPASLAAVAVSLPPPERLLASFWAQRAAAAAAAAAVARPGSTACGNAEDRPPAEAAA